MKRSRKQLMMVILYAAAVLCFAFGDAFKITALLWVMLGLPVEGRPGPEAPARRWPNSPPIAPTNWTKKSRPPPEGGALFPDTFIF